MMLRRFLLAAALAVAPLGAQALDPFGSGGPPLSSACLTSAPVGSNFSNAAFSGGSTVNSTRTTGAATAPLCSPAQTGAVVTMDATAAVSHGLAFAAGSTSAGAPITMTFYAKSLNPGLPYGVQSGISCTASCTVQVMTDLQSCQVFSTLASGTASAITASAQWFRDGWCQISTTLTLTIGTTTNNANFSLLRGRAVSLNGDGQGALALYGFSF